MSKTSESSAQRRPDVDVVRGVRTRGTDVAHRRERPRRPIWPTVVAALLIGIVLSATASKTWERDAEERNQEQLRSLTVLRKTYIDSALLRYADLMSALAALQAQPDRDPSALADDLAALRLEWQVGVDNAVFIRRYAPDQASVVAAAPHPSRLPTGYDFFTDPERAEALRLAVDSAVPVVGPVGQLKAHPARKRGDVDVIEIYLAVYPDGRAPDAAADRRSSAIGWVALTLDLEQAISTLAVPGSGLDMVLEIEDTGQVIGESRSGAAERIDTASLTESTVIPTGSRNFVLRTTFAPGRSETRDGLWIMAVGMVITGLSAYALALTMRHRRTLMGEAEHERERAELMTSRFYAAVEEAPVGVLVTDSAGNVELFNERLRVLVGAPPDAEVSIFDYVRPEDHGEVIESLRRISDDETDRVVSERQLVRHDGSLVWCRLSTSVSRGPDGEATGIVAHVQDIDNERRADEELRSRERWFSSIVEHARDLIVLMDAQGRVKWASPWVAHVFGVDPEQLPGTSVLDAVHPDDRAVVERAISQSAGGEPIEVEYRLRTATGEILWMESTTTNHLDDPDVAGIVAVSRDVTRRNQATQVLAHQAAHDPLTGLYNRAEMQLRLSAALTEARTVDEPLTVAFLDIDHFKHFNDRLGHRVGDDVLVRVADAIRAEVRSRDVVARIGGDEMVIGLVGSDLSTAVGIAERIRRRLRGAGDVQETSATSDGQADAEGYVPVTVSIGLATAGSDDDVDSVLHRADVALYEAKRRGRDQTASYSDDLPDDLGHEAHHDTEAHLDLVEHEREAAAPPAGSRP